MGRIVNDVFVISQLARPFAVLRLLGGMLPFAVFVSVQDNFLETAFDCTIFARFISKCREGAFERGQSLTSCRVGWPIISGNRERGIFPFATFVTRCKSNAVVGCVKQTINAVIVWRQIWKVPGALVGKSFR